MDQLEEEEMHNPAYYADEVHCFVSSCMRYRRDHPKNKFLTIPKSLKERWCRAFNRNCPKRPLYVCDDHVNIEHDCTKTKSGKFRLKQTANLCVTTSSYKQVSTQPATSQPQHFEPLPEDSCESSVSPITDPEEDVEVKIEPADDGAANIIMIQDPLTQASWQGSFKELHSHTPGEQLDKMFTQPSTSTATLVIKEELEEDYKEMFFKLKDEVELLKTENQSLIAENHSLAREIYNLKQQNINTNAVNDLQSVSKNNEFIKELAQENRRLSEKIYEYADKIRNITEKYSELNEDSSRMDEDQNVSEELENADDSGKKRRLLPKDNKNIVSERDNLKEKVLNLNMELENVIAENKVLKRNVKMQKKKIERLRIQCVNKSENIKRLKIIYLKLRFLYSKLEMFNRK